jgi:hypothetical protein
MAIAFFGRSALAIALLSACGGQQVAGNTAGVAPPGQPMFSKVAPDNKKCGGTNGVSVSPCPLIISKKSKGLAWFNVEGNGVVTSYLAGYQQEGNCYSKDGAEICSVQNLASPPTYWGATSGPHCGKAKQLTFYAYGVSGFIGYGYLRIINKYCP